MRLLWKRIPNARYTRVPTYYAKTKKSVDLGSAVKQNSRNP